MTHVTFNLKIRPIDLLNSIARHFRRKVDVASVELIALLVEMDLLPQIKITQLTQMIVETFNVRDVAQEGYRVITFQCRDLRSSEPVEGEVRLVMVYKDAWCKFGIRLMSDPFSTRLSGHGVEWKEPNLYFTRYNPDWPEWLKTLNTLFEMLFH
jgi:hypothetical protein